MFCALKCVVNFVGNIHGCVDDSVIAFEDRVGNGFVGRTI